MSSGKLKTAQTRSNQYFDQLSNLPNFSTLGFNELSNLLSSINTELTVPLRISANIPNSLTVVIEPSVISNSESFRNRSITHINGLIPDFSSGTIVFPSVSGGTITCTPGNNSLLTVSDGNYVKVLIYLSEDGLLSAIVGDEAASEALAVVPEPVSDTYSIAYITLFNNAGTIDPIAQDNIYQFTSGSTGISSKCKKIAGENLALRDYVYISTPDDIGRTTDRIYKVDVLDDNRMEALGFVSKAATTGNECEVTLFGIIKGFTGLTAGKMYFADTTAGAIVDSAPSVVYGWAVQAGLAITDTQLLINPVASSCAVLIVSGDVEFSIANNQTTPLNVTDLIFDGSFVRSFIVEYNVYRETDMESKAESGTLRGVYNTGTNTWHISDMGEGEGSVDFYIDNGQIQYTSSNLAGGSYIGKLTYSVVKTFEV